MKKTLLLFGLLSAGILAPQHAHAAPGTTPVLTSTMTCQGGISISTSSLSPTDMVYSNSEKAIYVFVSVTNLDGSANLFCNERADVGITGATRGKKILPGQTNTFTLTETGIHWYCRTDSASTTLADICKGGKLP